MSKTKVGDGKVLIELDSEESFKHLFQRRFGEDRFMKRLFLFFRQKLTLADGPVPLIDGARIIAFIKEDEGAAVRAYGRLLVATRKPTAPVAPPETHQEVEDPGDSA